uniref:Uncharacterized protein n=1 Tax=Panagrolaimus superbus TaxID=310955 RepID=A0A914Z9G9_9BILA
MKPFFTKLQESKTLPSISPSITTTTTKNGSQKTDSIPERAELNKKLLIEPHYASLLRHKCLGEHNSAKAREMRRRYPRNMGRPLQFREIKYLSLTVAQMFKEVNKMW